MTNERDKEGMDQLVSDTYRELSMERAPEELNEAILRMAASEGASTVNKSPLFAAWMKPVAWAATVGLTLVIVVELTEIPSELDQPLSAPSLESDDDVSLSAPVEIDMSAQKAKRKDEGSAPGAASFVPEQPRTPESRLLKEAVPPKSEPARSESAANEASRFRSYDQTIELKEALETTESCDATARESAESWLACIEALRSAGAAELAEREYLALKDKYPAETAELEANK